MKIVFTIWEMHNGRILPLIKEYPDYGSAEKAIDGLPNGHYQIQKIFKKE